MFIQCSPFFQSSCRVLSELRVFPGAGCDFPHAATFFHIIFYMGTEMYNIPYRLSTAIPISEKIHCNIWVRFYQGLHSQLVQKELNARTHTHAHTPTNPSYPLFPFCGLTLKFTVVSVVDESELVVPSLSSDPKNVERLLERPSYQDYQRLGLGNLSSVGQRSRTEPFRLTTVNSTYSVCRR